MATWSSFYVGLFIGMAVLMHGATTAAGAGTSRRAAASRPATLPDAPTVALDRDELERLYQAELGPLYQPEQFDRIRQAHLILEQYFLCTSSAQRKTAIERLDATGLEDRVLGRLAHIHLDWSALSPGVYYVNEKLGRSDVKYFLGVPKGYDRTHPLPLVIKLPTANAFMTDPPPNADQVMQIYTQWVKDELAAHPDAIVLMPLLNLDLLYGPSISGMNLVIQPMLHVTGKVNIRPDQVYLIGHSLAAHAVWNLAIHYPTYFTAINPMAGAAPAPWQRIRLGNLRNILPVVWADTSDDVIKAAESRAIVEYLRRMKYDVDCTETTDLHHVPSPALVDQMYAKLRSRTRELYPAHVYLQSDKPETMFNRADWVQVYQQLDSGEEQKFPIERSGEYMFRYKNSCRVVADITNDNTITLQTSNVETLRLYLNDQMVDLSRPVTVFVNEKQRFRGMVKQSTEEMLKDQLFLGRGWRYYTAVLDIDLTESSTQPSTQSATQPSHHGTIEYTLPNGERGTYTPK